MTDAQPRPIIDSNGVTVHLVPANASDPYHSMFLQVRFHGAHVWSKAYRFGQSLKMRHVRKANRIADRFERWDRKRHD